MKTLVDCSFANAIIVFGKPTTGDTSSTGDTSKPTTGDTSKPTTTILVFGKPTTGDPFKGRHQKLLSRDYRTNAH